LYKIKDARGVIVATAEHLSLATNYNYDISGTDSQGKRHILNVFRDPETYSYSFNSGESLYNKVDPETGSYYYNAGYNTLSPIEKLFKEHHDTIIKCLRTSCPGCNM